MNRFCRSMCWAISAWLVQGCAAPPQATPARLWTLADFLADAVPEGTYAGPLVPSSVAQAGQPLPLLSPPFAAATSVEQATRAGLNVIPAFSEGGTAAYVFTDIWQNYPVVWGQPLYEFVSAWDPNRPASKKLALPSVLDTDARSTFYSPYWQVVWVVVPPNTPSNQYVRASDILNAQLETHLGRWVLCPITPVSVGVAVQEGTAGPVRPLSGEDAGTSSDGIGWWDGSYVSYLDFGPDRYVVDGNDVVAESPLFFFQHFDAQGNGFDLPLPPVIGTGPVGSNTPVLAPMGKPQFGALSRRHTVVLPSTAGAFVLSAQPQLQALLASNGMATPPIDPIIEARADAAEYSLRVALNPSCFGDPVNFPASCQWLDSQARIEEGIRSVDINPTDVLMATAIVLYQGRVVQ